MNEQICFCIDGILLYLEKVLVDYMGIPIYFLCKNLEEYYLVLCTDINNLNYIIVKLTRTDVYNLLHGKIGMQEIIIMQNFFWEVNSAENVEDDEVIKKAMKYIDINVLPEKESDFRILTKDMEEYVKKYDVDFWKEKYLNDSDITLSNEKIEVFIEEIEPSICISVDAEEYNCFEFGISTSKIKRNPLGWLCSYDEEEKEIDVKNIGFKYTGIKVECDRYIDNCLIEAA